MNTKSYKFYVNLVAVTLLLFTAQSVIFGQQNKRVNLSTFADSRSTLPSILSAPIISTEKSLSQTGDVLTINGSGFRSFERVSFFVNAYNESLERDVPIMQWDFYADSNGRIVSNINLESLGSTNQRFKVRAFGNDSKLAAETEFLVPEAVGVDIEHCANGSQTAPIRCNVSTGNDGYTRGNLTATKAHYFEGDSVPVRLVATGLTVGQSYTVTIGYDFTKNGKYAFDYLTDYNRTESVNNDPCVGVSGCTLGSAKTFPIPTDPYVQANATSGQIPGNFTIFGGTITAVSGYTTTGSVSDTSTKLLTITFTADQENVVIAYGAHISTRDDWGVAAINISGSPYHNFISDFPGANQGNRDLQISEDAIIYPGRLIVIKNTGGIQSTYQFPFSVTGQITDSFVLDTSPATVSPTNTYTSPRIEYFGNSNSVTVSEGALSNGWQFRSRSCVDAGNGIGTSTISYSNISNAVTVSFVEGAYVTCTYINDLLLAAGSSISGKINNPFGRGLKGVTIRATALSTGETVTTKPDAEGNYRFEGLPVSESYLISIKARNFNFEPDSKVVTLNGDLVDVDFTVVNNGTTRSGK